MRKIITVMAVLIALASIMSACSAKSDPDVSSSITSESSSGVDTVTDGGSSSREAPVEVETDVGTGNETSSSAVAESSSNPSSQSSAVSQGNSPAPSTSVPSASAGSSGGAGNALSVTVAEESPASSRTLEITNSDTRDMILAWTEKLVKSDKGQRDIEPSMGSRVYEVVVMRDGVSETFYFTTMTDEVGRHYCNRSSDGESNWWLAASDSYERLEGLLDANMPAAGEAPHITVEQMAGFDTHTLEITDSAMQKKILGWVDGMIPSGKALDEFILPLDDEVAYTVTVRQNGIRKAYYFKAVTDEVGRHYCRNYSGEDVWWLAASDSYDSLQSLFS